MSEDNQPPVHPRPLLDAWREFWWMNEIDRSNAIEVRAKAHGGQGYLPPVNALERER
jgi:hypothetical protein